MRVDKTAFHEYKILYSRVRKEEERLPLLMSLVSRDFVEKTLVFVGTKVEAHRVHIILGLLGVKTGELHGNLSQAQRLYALEQFRDGKVDVLVATDVAARGLDISGVQTVINLRMPSTLKAYVHRVGRTARAGKVGRSVSLIGEGERKILKELIKRSNDPLKSRLVPPDVIEKFVEKEKSLQDAIQEVLEAEKTEKLIVQAEKQIKKGEEKLKNMDHPEEEEKEAKKIYPQHLQTRLVDKKKKKGKKAKKMNDAQDKEMQRAQAFQKRTIKKSMKPTRMRTLQGSSKGPDKSEGGGKKKGGSRFSMDLADTSKASVKNMRKLGGGKSFSTRKKKKFKGRK